MSKASIVSRKKENSIGTKGDFSVTFDHQEFGPYEYIFTRESLYFNQELDERGSFTFPLREKQFDNTEIFLEGDDIVIAVGKRGSISGSTQNFIDIINLQTQKKNRFFSDEVSLIYNTEKTLEVNLKIGTEFISYSLQRESLEELSQKEEKISAFFKLLYNWKTNSYENLVFQNSIGGQDTGYFLREPIRLEEARRQSLTPQYFVRKVFSLGIEEGTLDVWESSIYGELCFSNR